MARTVQPAKKHTTSGGNTLYQSQLDAMTKYDEKFDKIMVRTPQGTKARLQQYVAEHPEYKSVTDLLNCMIADLLNNAE